MHHLPNLTTGKRLLPLLIGAAALSLTASLHAVEPIGDNAELFITGAASMQYENNVFLLNVAPETGYIYTISPGLDLEFGKNSTLKGSLTASESWEYFQNVDVGNNHLGNVGLTANYDDGKSKVGVNASYTQTDQPTATFRVNTGVLVGHNSTTVGAVDEEMIDEKSSVSVGAVYSRDDYRAPGYSDTQSTTVPVNYYWKYDPKVDGSIGFQYRTATTQLGYDTKDYFFNIGARGEFTPLLSGQIRVGFANDSVSGGKKSNSTIGVDGSFKYAYSPKTNMILGLTNDYGYNAYGSGFRNSGVNFTINTALEPQWSANLGFGYNQYSYTTTKQLDNYYTGKFGVTYEASQSMTATAGITWMEDNSNIAANSFTNEIFSLSVMMRY
jgi:hypothetical protein